MNLAQSLGAAAGALMLAFSTSGVQPAQAMAEITAKARSYFQAETMFAGAEIAGRQHLTAQLDGYRSLIRQAARQRATSNDACEQEHRSVRAPLDAEMMKWGERIA